MATPFLSEIRIFGFTFPPHGWADCDGQILPINQHQSLYSLLGTTYGGDGRTTFALPDLRGRSPLHIGTGHPQGQKGGEETHTLVDGEMPNHGHAFEATADSANSTNPTGLLLARSAAALGSVYSAVGATMNVSLNSDTITHNGGSQAHENMQPYLALRFSIALTGVFPSRN